MACHEGINKAQETECPAYRAVKLPRLTAGRRAPSPRTPLPHLPGSEGASLVSVKVGSQAWRCIVPTAALCRH
jgi:hypothetical protein